MKLFSVLKLPMMLLGLGAGLFLAPTCKAQSEVSPDHFDGTDPWETVAGKPIAPQSKSAPANSYQAQNKKTGSSATLQMASEREVTKSVSHNAVAVQDKRKATARKNDKSEKEK